MITGYVHGQSLRLSAPTVASSTVDYLEAQFIFRQRDWDGLSVIKAVFEMGEAVYAIPLTDGRIRREDHLNLSAGIWSVHLVGSVYADGEIIQRITTEPDHLTVVQTGAVDGEPLPEVPPSETERLEAMVEAALEEIDKRADKYVANWRMDVKTESSGWRYTLVLVYNDGTEMAVALPSMGIDIGRVVKLGTTDPTGNTIGQYKQMYINTVTGAVWICVDEQIAMPATWIPLSGGNKTTITDNGDTVTVKFGG